MAHSTFTLTGKHTTPSGKAHTGRVKVRPNVVLRDAAGKVVLSGDEVATLDDAGAWSLTLPCDSPGLNPPTGLGYTITYNLSASGVNPQSFAATADLAGTVLDVSRVVSVVTPMPTTTLGPQIAFDTDGVPYFS